MKKILSLACGFSALLFASCASDEPIASDNTGVTTQDGDIYTTLTIKMPGVGTRAGDESANNGTEVGKDYENSVSKILVVLASKNSQGQYNMLATSESDAIKISDPTLPAGQSKYLVNFKSSDMKLNDPLDDPESDNPLHNQDVYIFVYCNPTKAVIERFTENIADFKVDNTFGNVETKGANEVWGENNFLMTNSAIVKAANLPSISKLVTEHNTPEKAFPLGEVPVKRVCARFDFATTGNNTYTIKGLDGSEMGEVEFTDMAMFNIQKRYFHLPHVANTWSWGTVNNTAYTLCGDLEGYVMSYNGGGSDREAFKNGTLAGTTYSSEYLCNLIGNNLSMTATGNNALEWVSIKPEIWNKRTEDTNGNWKPDDEDYRIWRYCTENTIPGGSNSSTATQKQGITTGVVFKAEFRPKDTETWDGDVIYVHNNIVYGDFKELKEYVEANPNSVVAKSFDNVEALKNAPENTNLKTNLLSGLSDSDEVRHGFVAYPANSEGKYIVYYFYFNRHKTNNNIAVMGEDEFGVVRNNVYKLKVTAVNQLGRPTAPKDPDTPDEKEIAYFTVQCKVMPWTVRVNNIEF
ncbi:MAG: Mfa1 family fimbria major subunit [Muribaculaceae bacterium]|nr:Mfa1 family fimbria major subunit [Muribaculaceae bacterium]